MTENTVTEISIKDLDTIKFDRGDVVLVRCPPEIHNMPQIAAIQKTLNSWTRDSGVRFIVMPNGFDVSVIRNTSDFETTLKRIALPDDDASLADPRQLAARARLALGLPTATELYESETIDDDGGDV